MSNQLLSLEIEKAYPGFRMEANLEVNEGEFFSLVGPSGCGKTTLLRLIVGLERPDRGRILLGGNDITSLPPARRRIGLVFQDYALFPHLTVVGNIEYGLKVNKVSASVRRQRVKELVDLFDLKGMAHRGVHQLSGGERQRVALARALAPQPLLLLLDEPFSALDYGLRQRLRRELRSLQKRLGFTAIFVTHQQEEALSLSDRLGVMQNGRVIQVGTASQVYEEPETPFVAQFFGDGNLLPCRVEGMEKKTRLTLEGGEKLILPLPEGLSSGEYLLMIRPEEVELNPGTLPVIEGKIEACEYLGYMCRVEIRIGERIIKALLSKEAFQRGTICEGGWVKIGINPQKIKFFRQSVREEKKFQRK